LSPNFFLNIINQVMFQIMLHHQQHVLQFLFQMMMHKILEIINQIILQILVHHVKHIFQLIFQMMGCTTVNYANNR
jgi:hypothetical protein